MADRGVGQLRHARHIGHVLAGFGLGILAALPLAAAEVALNAPRATDALRAELQAAASVFAVSAEAETRSTDLLAAARADYARLTAVLYQNALYSGTVSIRLDGREASDLSVLEIGGKIGRVEIAVEPGPAFVFGRASVQPLAPETELPEGFRAGAPATTPAMRRAVEVGVTAWRDAGHARADAVDQQITVDHAKQSVDARFAIAPGPRLRFGELRITTPSAVRAARLRAIAGLPQGEVFSPEEMRKAADRLRRSGAFSSVRLQEAETDGPDGTIDALLSVQDAPPRRVGFGAELSSTDGLSLSTFWLHRNLRGGAERLRLEAEISGIGGDSGGIDYLTKATYSYPAIWGADDTLVATIFAERLDEPNYKSDVFGVGVELEQARSDRLVTRFGTGLRKSRTEDGFGIRDFDHYILNGGLTWDGRDIALAPTRGIYADLNSLAFLGLGGSETGVQLKADLRTYRGFGAEDRTVLALRGQMGLVFGSDVANTPPELLFFSGGGGSVRGQEFQSLGVPLGGTTVGGRGFLAVSAELRQQITESIGFVGFVDYGYVSDQPDFTGTGDSHSGIGIGARYFTGIGPIRLDLAVPLSNRNSNFLGLYIGIGHAF